MNKGRETCDSILRIQELQYYCLPGCLGLWGTLSQITATCDLRASPLASVAARGGAEAVTTINLSFVQLDPKAENDPRCREVQAYRLLIRPPSAQSAKPTE
jgi:hypothetical protein